MNWKDISIIIVLIAVVGGLFAYEYWWTPKQEAKTNWQAFDVNKYGFSMKVPLDYEKKSLEEVDPDKNEGLLLGARFEKDANEGFILGIETKEKQVVKDAKETYQLEFERKEKLIGTHLFPNARIISIQKIEKKECQIFIFTSEKDDQTFYKLVLIFPNYREDLSFKMGFDYPTKEEEGIVTKMINSIECSSPIETSEWCPKGTYANFGGSDQYKITGIERHKIAGEEMDLCCGERIATRGIGKGKKCIDMPTGDYDYLIM